MSVSEWFKAVSATEAMFTARTRLYYSFDNFHVFHMFFKFFI